MNTDQIMTEETEADQADRYEEEAAEEQRRQRRMERIARMRREKERRLLQQKIVMIAAPVAAVLLIAFAAAAVIHGHSHAQEMEGAQTESRGAEAENTGEQAAADGTDQNGAGRNDVNQNDANQNDANQNDANQNGANQKRSDQNGAAADGEHNPADAGSAAEGGSALQSAGPVPEPVHYSAQTTSDTAAPPGEVNSTNAVFIDLETGNILAQRDYKAVVNPASMTKVLTVLVAAEHVTDLDDTFTMTIDITDYSYSNDCSSVGFAVGEVVTVRDLFYGTVLPSGGDAAVALATYVAGSQEAFVEMMNDKAQELGLSETAHFTNCVGLYDREHHCSVYDMAMIMEAAIDNEICREVLKAHTYTTSATEQHPEGITVSNWFLRRIEDKDTGGEVICAKTGYVDQSKSCAVSYGVDAGGRGYVCATAGAYSSWRCIYDHVAMYKAYARTGE